jgi:hypothetical protein
MFPAGQVQRRWLIRPPGLAALPERFELPTFSFVDHFGPVSQRAAKEGRNFLFHPDTLDVLFSHEQKFSISNSDYPVSVCPRLRPHGLRRRRSGHEDHQEGECATYRNLEWCRLIQGGDGPAAEALKKRPSDLTQLARKNGGSFPELQVINYIKGEDVVAAHGSRDMPVWGAIFSQMSSNQDLVHVRTYALLKYIEQLQVK